MLGAAERGRLARARRAHPFVPATREHVVGVVPYHVPPDDVLSILGAAELGLRTDLVGGSNRTGGSAGALGRFAEIGGWFFKTSAHRCFEQQSRALRDELAREELRQGLGIYSPARIWFASLGTDARVWCCSLTPTLPVLRDVWNATSPEADLTCWQLYLAAFEVSFECAATGAILLDCNPNNFALDGEKLRYIDDDLGVDGGRAPFGHQALLRLREYESSPLPSRQTFLDGFAALVRRYRHVRPLAESLLGDLEPETTWPREPALRAVLVELVRDLAGSGSEPSARGALAEPPVAAPRGARAADDTASAGAPVPHRSSGDES